MATWLGSLPGMEVTILMPCLNEELTIGRCVAQAHQWLAQCNVQGEVLVVDNGSADKSSKTAKEAGARVVQVSQRGYGSALQGGISAARGEYVIMGDADGSYDFSDLNPFLQKLRLGTALVIGNRFKGGIKAGAMPPLHRYFGTPALTLLGRVLFPNPCGDSLCGLRGFHRETILKLNIKSKGMEYASDMIITAAIEQIPIAEVPTALSKDGRNRPSHLRTWRDGFRILGLLLRTRFQTLSTKRKLNDNWHHYD